jgi:hypothetical protein
MAEWSRCSAFGRQVAPEVARMPAGFSSHEPGAASGHEARDDELGDYQWRVVKLKLPKKVARLNHARGNTINSE